MPKMTKTSKTLKFVQKRQEFNKHWKSDLNEQNKIGLGLGPKPIVTSWLLCTLLCSFGPEIANVRGKQVESGFVGQGFASQLNRNVTIHSFREIKLFSTCHNQSEVAKDKLQVRQKNKLNKPSNKFSTIRAKLTMF